EVVEANAVEAGEVVAQPLHPPGVAALLEHIPAVDRVAPELPGLAEIIRRDAGHDRRPLLFVELEKVRAHPHVGAVDADVDRYVADEIYFFLVRVMLERGPLLEKEVLEELLLFHLLAAALSPLRERAFFAVAQGRRPVDPGGVFEFRLERDEQAVVLEPVA